MSLLIIGIIAIISLGAIAMPFISDQDKNGAIVALSQKRRDELVTTYERILGTLRDIEEEFNTGKLDTETYQHEREHWSKEGVRILGILENDSIQLSSENISEGSLDDELDEVIEQTIQNYLNTSSK